MSFLSRESLILRQNLMYSSSIVSLPAATYHHILINFVAAEGEVTFDGSTSIASTGVSGLIQNNRIRFGALTGSVPTAVGTGTVFVQTITGTNTFAVASVMGGPALAVPSTTSTIEYTEQNPNGQDLLPIWVKNEVATGTGYQRFPFTFSASVVGTDNKVGPVALLATYAASGGDIIYNRIVTAYNANGTRGDTTGGVDTYSIPGAIQISDGETFEFPIDIKTALVDPSTVPIAI